jgi:hypothetical protein
VEIFDMAGVSEKEGISLAVLERCGQGHTIVAILLDATAFWRYDNRESLLQTGAGDDGEDEIDDGESTRCLFLMLFSGVLMLPCIIQTTVCEMMLVLLLL